MNLKTTPLLFGLLLGILWLFGLTLVYKKGAVDESFLMPDMQKPDTKVDTIRFEFKEKPEVIFHQDKDTWFHQKGELRERVENFKVEDMVRQIKNVKRNEDERVQNDVSFYGLPPEGKPTMTVTLTGKLKSRDKQWVLYIGNSDATGSIVYVNTSDRPGRAYPVSKSTLDSLFFKSVDDLRPKRLFDTAEASVAYVSATRDKDGLVLEKADNAWRFKEPPLGFADFGSLPTPAPSTGPEDALKKDKTPVSAVKGLIEAIAGLQVGSEQDFEPLGNKALSEYGLDEKDAYMRIALGTSPPKGKEEKKDDDAKNEEKKDHQEVLLVGKRVAPAAASKRNEEQYYARMRIDQGVFRLNAAALEPIKNAVENPKKLRSHDVVAYETKKVDAVVITTSHTHKDDKGKESTVKQEVKLARIDEKDWKVQATGDKVRKGNEKAITGLLDALQGKKDITEFADAVKDDSWGGVNAPTASDISVYIDSLEKEKKDKDAKKDEKKDEKKDAKDEKKEDKETLPEFKKDVKPFVRLVIGTVDKDKKIAHVKRVLQDGTVSYFTVPYSYVEKLHLDEGVLPYIDSALPSRPISDVVAMDIQRGKERIEVDRSPESSFVARWTLRDAHDPQGGKPADTNKVTDLIRRLTSLQARKWVNKDDAEKLGLKEPQIVVTLHVKKEDRTTAVGGATLVGVFASPVGAVPVPAFGPALINRLDQPVPALGDRITIKFGKEIEEDKQKVVYAAQSDSDLAFLVPAELVKTIRDVDLRDRSAVTHTQGQLVATLIGQAGEPSLNALPLASPLLTGAIHAFDPAKVKEVNLTLRTKIELRSFTFGRVDKTWVDQSGTKEFTLDTDRVTQLLDAICKLKTDRFASFGGPTGDSKLTPDEATLRIELRFEDKTRVTLTIGAQFGQLGYFANSDAWPQAVFFVPATMVDPWLGGAGYFGKERAAAGG
jgi:hypothetical protein